MFNTEYFTWCCGFLQIRSHIYEDINFHDKEFLHPSSNLGEGKQNAFAYIPFGFFYNSCREGLFWFGREHTRWVPTYIGIIVIAT